MKIAGSLQPPPPDPIPLTSASTPTTSQALADFDASLASKKELLVSALVIQVIGCMWVHGGEGVCRGGLRSVH